MKTGIYSCSVVLQWAFYEQLSFTLLVALPLPAPAYLFQVVCLALFPLISGKICVFWVNGTMYLNKFSFLDFCLWKTEFCEVIL